MRALMAFVKSMTPSNLQFVFTIIKEKTIQYYMKISKTMLHRLV
jgi:hypothetical protein